MGNKRKFTKNLNPSRSISFPTTRSGAGNRGYGLFISQQKKNLSHKIKKDHIRLIKAISVRENPLELYDPFPPSKLPFPTRDKKV